MIGAKGRARVAFGVAVAASAWVLLSWASRGWLRVDDFNALGSRLELVDEHGLWSGLHAAHNDHWSAVFFALHLVLVSVAGLDSYVPMAVLAVAGACAVVCVVRVCLVRLGVRPWVAALWPPALLWWGTAPLSVLWGFDAVFTMAAAVVLLTAVLLDRPERWARVTLAVVLLVGAAVQGAVLIGAGTVTVVWSLSAAGNAARKIRAQVGALVLAPCVAATVAWWALRDPRPVVWARLPGERDLYNTPPELVGGLRYAVAIGRRVLSGFVPGPVAGPVAWCTAVLVGAGLVSTMVRHRRDPVASPFVLGLPVTAVVIALVIGVARAGSGQGADVSRYLSLLTALLFPLAGLATSDAIGWALRRTRGTMQHALAVGVSVGLLLGTVVVGGVRVRAESEVVERQGRETKALLASHLADPLLGLVPPETRVAFLALDMNVGHLRRWAERGWLTPDPGSDEVRATAALWIHVRPADDSAAPALALVDADTASTCWSSAGGVRTAQVELLGGRTGAVRWTDRPRRVWARVTIGGATTAWRQLRAARSLEIDGVEGALVEIRVSGATSTC